MQLKRLLLSLFLLAAVLHAPAARAQADPEGNFDTDILFSYYDQDGDHSPVTGGIGDEAIQVFSPVILFAWRINGQLTLSADIGVDQVSSASIGRIQAELSSASIPASDTRTFATFKLERKFGPQTWGMTLGGANEYDYQSLSLGVSWGMEWNEANTAASVSLRHYEDSIDLIGIDGYGFQGDGLPRTEGSGDRTTTDAYISLSQTLSRRTAGAIELFVSLQDGVLSTPYHEVLLISNSPQHPHGRAVAERLPDSRERTAIGLRLNHAFTDRLVQRTGYRYYSDDWGISSHTIDLETHFRLPTNREMWVYPILRYHTQTGADYFGLPQTFTGLEDYYTSDWDLAETSAQKYGVGWSVSTLPNEHWYLLMDRFEMRGSFYDRDDGLSAFTTSFSFGWTY